MNVKRRLLAVLAALALMLVTVGPTVASHDTRPGGGQECHGLSDEAPVGDGYCD